MNHPNTSYFAVNHTFPAGKLNVNHRHEIYLSDIDKLRMAVLIKNTICIEMQKMRCALISDIQMQLERRR